MSFQDAHEYSSYELEIEELLELTPSYPDLLNRRGLLRYHSKDWATARADFVAALTRNPNYDEARVNLAFALAPEDPDGAIKLVADVAKSSREPCMNFVDMACLCYETGRTSEAWNALFHAMELSPGDPRPHHWAAIFALRQEREREARVHAVRCLRRDGWCVEGYETIGAYQDSKLDLCALAEALSGASANPRFSTIHVDVAHWHAARNERGEAKRELEKMLALDPSFARYATARGRMELLWGHSRRAERWLRRAVECEPDRPMAHEVLGQLYGARGDDLRAERHLVRACTHNPNYPDIRYDLARLCSRTDRIDEALCYYRSCLAIDPEFAMARFRLAECYLAMGQPDCARTELEKLPEDVRQRPEVRAVVTRCSAKTTTA